MERSRPRSIAAETFIREVTREAPPDMPLGDFRRHVAGAIKALDASLNSAGSTDAKARLLDGMIRQFHLRTERAPICDEERRSIVADSLGNWAVRSARRTQGKFANTGDEAVSLSPQAVVDRLTIARFVGRQVWWVGHANAIHRPDSKGNLADPYHRVSALETARGLAEAAAGLLREVPSDRNDVTELIKCLDRDVKTFGKEASDLLNSLNPSDVDPRELVALERDLLSL